MCSRDGSVSPNFDRGLHLVVMGRVGTAQPAILLRRLAVV
jgi:hypothetical protein